MCLAPRGSHGRDLLRLGPRRHGLAHRVHRLREFPRGLGLAAQDRDRLRRHGVPLPAVDDGPHAEVPHGDVLELPLVPDL